MNKKPATDFVVLQGETYIIGVGSVGQPKDWPTPAYVIFDSEALSIEFVRLDQLK